MPTIEAIASFTHGMFAKLTQMCNGSCCHDVGSSNMFSYVGIVSQVVPVAMLQLARKLM